MIHIVVEYHNHQTRFFPVPDTQGWRISTADRCIIIGRGVPRIVVPLDTVANFTIEDCTPNGGSQ